MVATALEPEIKERLERLAAANHVTLSAYIRAIIVDALAEEEDKRPISSAGEDSAGFGETPP